LSERTKSPVHEVTPYGLEEFSKPSLGRQRTAVSAGETVREKERDAYERGYKAGEEAGYAFGNQKAKILVDRMNAIAVALESFREELSANLEPKMVELALEIAEKVVQEEIRTNPDVVLNIAREALRRVANWKEITVRVNSADLEYLKENGKDLVEGNRELRFVADDSVAPGGCLIQEEYGEVDARIEQQLNEIRDELIG